MEFCAIGKESCDAVFGFKAGEGERKGEDVGCGGKVRGFLC